MRRGRALCRRKRPLASKPIGAYSDGYALAIANAGGAFKRLVGNVEAKNIRFGLTGDITLHDTSPIKALPPKPMACHRICRCALRHRARCGWIALADRIENLK